MPRYLDTSQEGFFEVPLEPAQGRAQPTGAAQGLVAMRMRSAAADQTTTDNYDALICLCHAHLCELDGRFSLAGCTYCVLFLFLEIFWWWHEKKR